MRKKLSAFAIMLAAAAVVLPAVTFAALNPNLSQQINPGLLTANIVNGSGVNVVSPVVGFPAVDWSFDCVTSSAPLFTASQKLRISNKVKDGVKVDLNASAPGTKWTGQALSTNQYAYDDPTTDGTTAGCENGQMTVATTGATFTQNKGTAVAATLLAADTAFSSLSPITLATTTDDTAFEADLTGYALQQKIPAEQNDDTYNLSMTLSVIAN